MIRVIQHIRRSLAACRLGVRYGRTSRFMSGPSPGSIRWEGQSVPLALPDEHGVRAAFVEVFLDDVYRVGAMARSGWRPRGIVDIGANVGFFTLWAGLHFPGSSIDAYEPNPAVLRSLRANAARVRARVHAEAVGVQDGRVRGVEGSDSLLYRVERDPMGTCTCVALARVIDDVGGDVDLLKMDCEGAEWELLGQVEQMKCVRTLMVEFHGVRGERRARYRAILKRLGFDSIRVREGGNESAVLVTARRML